MSPGIGTQITPLEWRIVNAISSGVALLAAKIRSPSFSRVSSSTTTTALPAAMSSIARSTLSSLTVMSLLLRVGANELLQVLGDVLGDHVDLEVDPVTGLAEAEGGAGERLGDQADREPVGARLDDGEADAVDT